MIKNWLVKTKQIKKKEDGFINHINYLADEKRSSHYYSRIRILNDKAGNILKAFDDRTAYRQKKGLRGGGVSNYATTFIMSLPRDIKQPTDNEWLKISAEMIKDLAKINNIKVDKIKEHCHIVLHDESKSDDKPSHIHVVVSNVIDNEVVKSISQYKSTDAVKKSFNRSVKAILNVDNTKYQPKEENVPDVPYWVLRQEKIKRYIKTAREIQQNFSSWFKTFKDSLYRPAERHADALNQNIEEMYQIHKKTALNADLEADFVEEQYSTDETPPEAKVSSKRKRRRRK